MRSGHGETGWRYSYLVSISDGDKEFAAAVLALAVPSATEKANNAALLRVSF